MTAATRASEWRLDTRVPDWVVLDRIRTLIRSGQHVPAEVYEPDALADYVPALLADGHTISEIYRNPRRTK